MAVEDYAAGYSCRQPRTIRDKPSPKMVCRRDVDPGHDTALCIRLPDGYRLPESASSSRSLDNQPFRREKFRPDLLFPTIFPTIVGVNINR